MSRSGSLSPADFAVEDELSEGIFQIGDLGGAEEALDLHGDLPPFLVRGEQTLGPEVDEDILLADMNLAAGSSVIVQPSVINAALNTSW